MRKRRRKSTIRILPEHKGRGFRGGQVVTSRTARVGARGRTRKTNKFSADFVINEPYEVDIDSRKMLMLVADEMFDRIMGGLKGDYDPGTGRKHPPHARISDEVRKLMIKSLKRTFTDSTARWGGGFKQLNVPRSTVKFYFADKRAAGINKVQSQWKGKDKVLRLSIKGPVGDDIARGLHRYAVRATAGGIFGADSKAKTRGR